MSVGALARMRSDLGIGAPAPRRADLRKENRHLMS
jgi:hypothetical protein